MSEIQVGIGSSELDEASKAGMSAATAAVEALGGESPALVLVYASVRYDLPALLASIREVTGDAPLAGASTSGHFHDGDLTRPGCGVAVLALTAGRYRFGIGSAAGLRGDGFEAGRAVVASARDAAGTRSAPHNAVLLLSCGLTGDQQNLLNGIYRVTGAAVPIVGGAASDDRRMTETYVFHDGAVLTDSAVAVWIASEHPLNVVNGHGWRPLGLPMSITGVDGPVVQTIAGRPAIEVFRENLREAQEPGGDGGSRREEASAPAEKIVRMGDVGRCLGLIEPDGTRMIRGVFSDNDTVRTWVPLPPYAAVQIMACSQDDLLDGCDKIPAQALAGTDAGVILAFSCVARLEMLRERGAEEAERLQAAAGSVPTFGFYTYGEFARTTSVNGVHNATVTALAL